VRFDKRDAAAANEAAFDGGGVALGGGGDAGGAVGRAAIPVGGVGAARACGRGPRGGDMVEYLHVSFAVSLPGWVLETARVRLWGALKARHPILSVWFVYDEGAPRAMRSLVIYIETVWLMALQALAFYLNFPPTLLAACAAYKVCPPNC
jgi:hypothetical protein